MILSNIRDIAIIIIAFQSIVIGILIAVLIMQIWRLTKMMQTEVKPMVEDIQETLGTVRGTTTFVSENVVDPVVKTGRMTARVRRGIQVFRTELNETKALWGQSQERQKPSNNQFD